MIRLEQNYRSTQRILDAANGVIAHNTGRQEKRLWSDLGSGEPVRLVECEDEQSEARLVVSQIGGLLNEGYAASDVAIFYRTNAQSRVIEDLLRRHDIAYQVVGGLRFYDRAEVKDALAYLQVLINPADAISLRRIINAPRRGIGDTTVSRLIQHAEAFGMTLRDALREADEALPNAAARKAVTAFSELLDSLEALVPEKGVADLLERVLDDSGYPRRAARGADDRGPWPAREPRRAGRRGARVRRPRRRRGPRDVPAGAVAGVRRRRGRAHRPLAGDADDAAHREGPRVPGRLPGRHGGRRLPAPARDRGVEPRGGAPALLRRHDAGPRAADADVLPQPHAVRQPQLEPAVDLPGRDPVRRGRARAPARAARGGRLAHVELVRPRPGRLRARAAARLRPPDAVDGRLEAAAGAARATTARSRCSPPATPSATRSGGRGS